MKLVSLLIFSAVLFCILTFSNCSTLKAKTSQTPSNTSTLVAKCPEWEIIDRFQDSGGQTARTSSLLTDSSGHLFSSVYLDPNYNRWIVRKSTDHGKTWTTSDSFQVVPDELNYALGMTEGAAGSILVAGVLANATQTRGAIRRSQDVGHSWSTVNDYLYPGSGDCKFYEVKKIGTALFSLGRCHDGTTTHWLVLRSLDNGDTWTVVDFPHLDQPYYSKAFAITRANNGDLLALGIQDSSTSEHMLIRKSADGGTSWNTVDDYQRTPGNPQAVGHIMTTSKGAILANGWALENGGTSARGLIRRSGDGGTTWNTTDDFKYKNQMTLYEEIAEDSWGRLFAIAESAQQPVNEGVVRLSADDGLTWQDYSYLKGENGQNAGFGRIYISPADELFIAGGQGSPAIVQRLQLVAPERRCHQ